MMTVILTGSALLILALLLTCVIGIANGPVGLVVLYEEDVQERAVALGYLTRKQLRRQLLLTCLALFLPQLILIPLQVYLMGGAEDFTSAFLNIAAIYWIAGLFDRLFIDWYWVGRTKAWIIPGTEDLRPYIPPRVLLRKWIGTILVYPLMAAALAWLLMLI